MRVNHNNVDTVKKLVEKNRIARDKIDHQVALGIPIDLCVDCYLDGGHSDDVDHPGYSSGLYSCFGCGRTLVELDG